MDLGVVVRNLFMNEWMWFGSVDGKNLLLLRT